MNVYKICMRVKPLYVYTCILRILEYFSIKEFYLKFESGKSTIKNLVDLTTKTGGVGPTTNYFVIFTESAHWADSVI